MIDQLEADLREALADRAAQLPPDASARLRAIDYHPRASRLRRRVAVGTVAGLAGAAGAAFAIVGPATPNAFAGWAATPAAAATSPTAAGAATCAAAFAPQSPPSAPVVLTDVRGPWTLAIAADGTTTVSCWTGPSVAAGFVTDTGPNAALVAPPAGQVEVAVAAAHQAPDGGAPYELLTGRAGAGVTAVTLVLADGTQVQTTTSDGWFAAWWPGTQTATTAQLTTTTGETTQQLTDGLPTSSATTTTPASSTSN